MNSMIKSHLQHTAKVRILEVVLHNFYRLLIREDGQPGAQLLALLGGVLKLHVLPDKHPVASLVGLGVEAHRDANLGPVTVEVLLAPAGGLVLLSDTLGESHLAPEMVQFSQSELNTSQPEWSSLIGPDPSRYCALIG